MSHQINLIKDLADIKYEIVLASSKEDGKKLTAICRPFSKTYTYRLYYEWGISSKNPFDEHIDLRTAVAAYNNI
ncbi:MAG: hypothetical protein ACFFDY_01395 [Candidatus Thorarchaeota archaeon]